MNNTKLILEKARLREKEIEARSSILKLEQKARLRETEIEARSLIIKLEQKTLDNEEK